MRNYLDRYINSLSSGDRQLASSFIYRDRRNLNSDISEAMQPTSYSSYRFGKIRKMSVVTSASFSSFISNTLIYLDEIYETTNNSDAILSALLTQSDIKMDRIEAALQCIENEIYDWETYLSSTSTSSEIISRSYGPLGLRPVSEVGNDLLLLNCVVQANYKVKCEGGMVVAECKDKISTPFFCDDDGLQVRFTYNFAPGPVDKIQLEPLAIAGSLTIIEMRAYGPNGELISTITSNESIPRTLKAYSIPRSTLARIEIDILDSTFNIIEAAPGMAEEGGGVIRRPLMPMPSRTPDEVLFKNAGADTTTTGYDNIDTLSVDMGRITKEAISKDILDQDSLYTIDSVIKSTYIGGPADRIYLPLPFPRPGQRTKYYYYGCGLKNLICASNNFHQNATTTERLTFANGIPGYLTLTTDEYLPTGSFINFYLKTDDGQKIPLLPKNRELTSEILHFSKAGKAKLMFSPEGLVSFYRDDAKQIGLTMNGTTVLAPALGLETYKTLGGSVLWAVYEPNHLKSNVISYPGRVSTYVSESGQTGESYDRIPESKQITLKETPYIDQARLGDSTYSPVQITVSGYMAIDYTNYDSKEESDFPVSQEWEEGTRLLHYKVRGKTVFFEESVDRPVRIFYERTANTALLVIETGQIYATAAPPVLYSYQISYI